MSTAQAEFGPLSHSRGRSLSFAAAFGNLLLKELRESLEAVIVGICAFWLVPADLYFISAFDDAPALPFRPLAEEVPSTDATNAEPATTPTQTSEAAP